jgi:hypothetical protein
MNGELDVRISGVEEDDLRRWHPKTGSGSPSGGGLLVTVIPIICLLWIASALVAEPPEIEQGGQVIRGAHVLLIQDGSSSMDSYQAVVAQRLAALSAASAYSGFGCLTSDAEFVDFADCVVREARGADVDAFYVFADFRWAGVDDAGVARVREALDGAGIRLYLETISADPDPRLAALAASSGGAVIHTPM